MGVQGFGRTEVRLHQRRLFGALAIMAISLVAILAQFPSATTARASGDCWAAGCDHVYPYWDSRFAPPWSGCAGERAVLVETVRTVTDEHSVMLWYSWDCNANWTRAQMITFCCSQYWEFIHSRSPAWNDETLRMDNLDQSTHMVDGGYLAQACLGDIGCTGWH